MLFSAAPFATEYKKLKIELKPVKCHEMLSLKKKNDEAKETLSISIRDI